MSYIRKNINLLLLILAVLLIGYTLSLTTYYQVTYNNVSSIYYDQVQEYEDLINDFKEREEELSVTQLELTKRVQDKEKLNELYTGAIGEKESAESKTLRAEADLSTANSQIKMQEAEIKDYKDQLEDVESIKSSIEDEIDDLKDDFRDDSNLSSSDVDDLFENLEEIIEDI